VFKLAQQLEYRIPGSKPEIELFSLLQLVVACAALSAAAPDAQFAYTVGATPLIYPYAAPYVIPAVAAGCRNDAGAVVPCAGAVPFVAPLAVAAAPAEAAPAAAEAAPAVEAVERKRREAEPEAEAKADADPEADPWLYYSSYYGAAPYGYYGYAPYSYSYSYAPYTYSYAPYSYYNPYSYAYYGRKKREAEAAPEADPEAEADPYLLYSYPYAYSAYSYAPYAYSYAPYAYSYAPYAYAYSGCRNNYGAAVPCA
jgi:hypothetical protein